MNHRERHPQFTYPPITRGWKPSDEPVSGAAIATAVIAWLVLLAAAAAFMLPLALRLVHWVLRGG